MFDFIKGKIVRKSPGSVVLDVGGVGYSISTTLTVFDKLPSIGDEFSISVHLHVKENPMSVQLFGFADETERDCFLQIISVSGIGPKSAMTILSAIHYTEFIEMIAKGNYLPLTSISGVGKKTAERLALELKDKIGKIGSASSHSTAYSRIKANSKDEEIINALMSLGYNRIEAEKMLRTVSGKDGFGEMPVEEIIKNILRSG